MTEIYIAGEDKPVGVIKEWNESNRCADNHYVAPTFPVGEVTGTIKLTKRTIKTLKKITKGMVSVGIAIKMFAKTFLTDKQKGKIKYMKRMLGRKNKKRDRRKA
jgi:hypothetical protein